MRGFRDVQWREQPAVLSLAGRIKLTRPSFHTEPIHTNAGRLASERVDREEARLPQVQQHLRRAYTRAVPSSHAAFGCHWPPLFKAIYMLVMLPLLSVDCHCLWIYRVILLPSLPFSAEAMAVPPPGLGAPRGCETIFSSSPRRARRRRRQRHQRRQRGRRHQPPYLGTSSTLSFPSTSTCIRRVI